MAKTKKNTKKKTTAKKTKSKKAIRKAKPARKKATPKLARTAPKSNAPALGDLVPNFEAIATGGHRVTMTGLKGKTVVLYFYPKDATPGCTIEGHEFTRLHSQFKDMNVEVYGVSRDSLDSHEKFKTKECYSIDLLSDEAGQLCQMFDVIKLKNMYGKQVKGIERSTFVINPEGRLIKEWRGVKAEGHAQAVLDFLSQRP